jgi:hypothetical protein
MTTLALRDRHLAGEITGDVTDVRRRDGAVWKIARQPVDNDLLDAEAAALRKLAGSRFDPYFPELRDSVTLRDPVTGADRRASVLAPLDGFVHLRDPVNGRGHDPRDVAWTLLHELDDLLERLYGPRRFRPFHLPAGTPRT